MKNSIQLFHTSPVHVARFEHVRNQNSLKLPIFHTVREDWLDRAKSGIDSELEREVLDAFRDSGPALCSCSTLGPLAERAGITRIDRPMMEEAVGADSVVLAYCLESTAETSVALAREVGLTVTSLPLFDAWDAFASGNQQAYAREIAAGVTAHAAKAPPRTVYLLGQASMDVAVPLLSHEIDVRTPADSAFRAAMKKAGYSPA